MIRLSSLQVLLTFALLSASDSLLAQGCLNGTPTTVPVGNWASATVPGSTTVVRNLTVGAGVLTGHALCTAPFLGVIPSPVIVSGPYFTPGTTLSGASCPGTPSIAPIASGAPAQHTIQLSQWGSNFPPDAPGFNGLLGAQNCSVCPAAFQASICAGQFFNYYMCPGRTYTFSLCGSAAWDSNITIANNAGTALATGYPSPAFDDNGCGAPSQHAIISFTPQTALTYQVRVFANPCATNGGLCGTMTVQCSLNPPPPANDNPTTATALPFSQSCNFSNGSNVFATNPSGGNPATPNFCDVACTTGNTGSYSGGDVWFTFPVGAAGTLSIQTELISAPNIAMAVYTGTPGALVQATGAAGCSCNDDSSVGILNPYISLSGLPPGLVYIRVWPPGGVSNMGTFRICAYEPVPPPNDDPCGAIVLPVPAACSPTGATTENATLFAGLNPPTLCGPIVGGDVWFQVTMPPTGSMTISTTAGAVTDMSMEVFTFTGTACAPTLTSVGCATANGASLMPRMIVTGTNGTVYLVRLWSPTTTTGTFSICAFQNNPPPNDNPCGAIALTVNTGCIYPSPFTTEYATLTGSPGLPGCGGTPNDDVWFTAVVPASGQLQLSTDDFQITNAAMALYTGACGSLTLVAGSCQTGGTGMPQQTVALPAGTTVYIRVWREAGNAGTFLLCARNPLNPTGCYFTLNMADAAGDGWNGGFVTLDVGGVQTNYTVTGSTAFITFPATTGQVVTFSYTPAGGFQNQVSFNVLANNGFSLFASASPPLTGVNYGFTVNTTCNVPPSPISDCLGAFEVCSNQNINLAPSSGGNVDDLTAVNRGCLLGGETQGAWFRFRASVAGNLAFSINVTGGTDYDFAVWGPYSTAPTCIPLGPPGPPIRCSWSALPTSTGLNYTALDATEGALGDAWVSDIPVALGDQFLLYVDNWTNNSTIFNLVWNNQPPNLLDCSIVLPVELLAFEANAKPDHVVLKWTTASESNSSHFNVERSVDGRTFTRIGTVAARGYTHTLSEYAFIDRSPNSGVNYYRLEQVDITGEMALSEVVTAVYKGGRIQLNVYPNPTNGNLWMAMEMPTEGATTWKVLDASGRIVRTGRSAVGIGMNQVEIDLAGVDQGSYVVELIGSEGTPLGTARFVRQ